MSTHLQYNNRSYSMSENTIENIMFQFTSRRAATTTPVHFMAFHQDRKKSQRKTNPPMQPEGSDLAYRAVWISSASVLIPTHASLKQLAGRVCLAQLPTHVNLSIASGIQFTRNTRYGHNDLLSCKCTQELTDQLGHISSVHYFSIIQS